MLEYKHINKILSIHPKNSTLNILNLGIVEDKKLKITDLDYNLILHDVNLSDDTVISILDYKKTKNITASIVDGYSKDEFPIMFTKNNPIKLPNDIFNDISDFTNYTSTDFTSRIILTGVFYNFDNGEICSTNGHILHKRKVDKFEHKRQFVISRKYTNLIQYINDNIGITKIILWDRIEKQDKNEPEYTIEIQFNGGIIYFRCLVGIYPEYNRIIPEINNIEKKIKMDIENKKYLLNIVSTLNKYTNETGDMHFLNDVVLCKKDEKTFYTELKYTPFIYTKIKRLNGDYLEVILKTIKDDVHYYDNERTLGACVFYNDIHTYVIMPKRFKDDCEFEEDVLNDLRNSIKDGIHIDIKDIKIKKKSLTVNDILTIIRKNKDKTGCDILKLIEDTPSKKSKLQKFMKKY